MIKLIHGFFQITWAISAVFLRPSTTMCGIHKSSFACIHDWLDIKDNCVLNLLNSMWTNFPKFLASNRASGTQFTMIPWRWKCKTPHNAKQKCLSEKTNSSKQQQVEWLQKEFSATLLAHLPDSYFQECPTQPCAVPLQMMQTNGSFNAIIHSYGFCDVSCQYIVYYLQSFTNVSQFCSRCLECARTDRDTNRPRRRTCGTWCTDWLAPPIWESS